MLILSILVCMMYMLSIYFIQIYTPNVNIEFSNLLILVGFLFFNSIFSQLKSWAEKSKTLRNYAKLSLFLKILDAILVGLIYGAAILAMIYFQATFQTFSGSL